jgi:hypothetical protein
MFGCDGKHLGFPKLGPAFQVEFCLYWLICQRTDTGGMRMVLRGSSDQIWVDRSLVALSR